METANVLVWGLVLFVLPGYALLVLFNPWPDADLIELLCAASGLSIAVAPLLLYLCTLLGLRLNAAGLLVFLFLAGATCVWDWRQRFLRWHDQTNQRTDPVYVLLSLAFLLTVYARLWMVRDIAYPLWTDSYHHTLIAQLIADEGMVPISYEPYLPIGSFTYHFGFHTLAAWFNWISGIPIPRSVVLVGQFINALAVPTTYLLTKRLFRNRHAGLASAWVVGLISHLPTFFVNWGRYTQLSGQVLLPILMVLTLGAFDLDAEPANRRTWVLTGIGVAGLFLVHNRILLFYALFAGWLLLFQLARAYRKPQRFKRLLAGSLAIGGVAAVVALPWLLRFFSGFGATVAKAVASEYQAQDYGSYFAFQIQDVLDYGMRGELLLVAALGGVWGIVKKELKVWLLLAWLASLFVAANSNVIHITPLFSNTIVVICIYLPAAALIGYLVSALIELGARWVYRQRPLVVRIMKASAVAAFALISLWGVGYTARLIVPENGFVRPADLKAMSWIRDNVPQDALFHISAHFWQPDVVHGLDAGFWIPLLARRQTTIPAQVYESDGSASYAEFINRRARELLGAGTPEQLWKVLKQYNVTYVYIGSRQANLRPDFFLADPAHFRALYSEDNVWVFGVIG